MSDPPSAARLPGRPFLSEERGWVKGRNHCWKSDDKRRCFEEAYALRIAESQAKYRLVAATDPVFYACEGDPRNEVIATFFQTDPRHSSRSAVTMFH